MNEKNFEYLRDQVRFTGFGDALEGALRENMQREAPEFQLHHQATFGQDRVAAVLHFRRSEQQGLYFFNRYLVVLRPENAADIREQTFFIHKGNNITLKEAYNLLQGRAVHKELTSREGQRYHAWVQLDLTLQDTGGNFPLKHYHAHYGFDLEKTLARFHIRELEDPQQREQLLNSLRKGNRQLVTALEEGYEVKRYVEASPRFKTINVYNEQGQRAMRETIQRQETGPGEFLRRDAAARQERRAEKDGQGQEATQRQGARKNRSLRP